MTPRRATLTAVLRRAVRAHALGGRAENVAVAVRRAAGVYGSAPTCHLGVQARTAGYCPADLDEAVLRTRELVRVRAMRGSVYLVPRELVPHALAFSPLRSVAHYARVAGIAESSYAPLTARIEEIVSGTPRTAAEIRAALGGDAPKEAGLTAILGRMGREARIVRAGVRGGERSQTYEYARMAEWIELPKERPSLVEALAAWAPLWLAANGPATAADFAWWAGVGVRDAARALTAAGTRPVTVEGIEGELLATEEVAEDLAAKAQADDEIHLIPCWDAYVMSHADRTRYLDAAHRPYVIDAMGNVTHVVLRGGRIAGVWDFDSCTLLYAAFGKLNGRALQAAAERLAPLHEIAELREIANPTPLREARKNAFLAPLRDPGSRRKP